MPETKPVRAAVITPPGEGGIGIIALSGPGAGRVLDRVFTLGMLSLMYPLVRTWQRKWLPDFANRQAMGIDAVFR